ncbi:MBG domain-containing protein [Reichenbachiella sp.]|uniref:MBG domain-containing protein n=1 Tax=Reichenbachiella sp. TaxID=2184521 RepID=UPI003BB0D644
MNLISTKQLEKIKVQWSYIDKVLLSILIFTICLAMTFVASAQDTTPPTISSLSPSNYETGVDPAVGTLTMTLSETVVANDALSETYDEIRLRRLSGTVIQEFEIDEVTQVGISGNVITLKNVQTLSYGETYYIQLWSGGPGMFLDLAGNKLQDFNNNTTWRFTVRSSDLYIVSTYPSDNASFIDPEADEDYTITFNQNVYLNYTWWLEVRDDADANHLGFSTGSSQYMEVSGNTVTLKRRDIDLPFGENLHFYIPSTAFKDGNNRNFEGIAWGDHTTWNFTTKTETTPPGIKKLIPAHTEEGVNRGTSTFSIQFNEEVTLDTKGSIVELYLKGKGGNTQVAFTDSRGITESEGYYHITFSGLEGLIEGGDYFVAIPDDLFYDDQHNFFEGTDDTNWRFLANRKPSKINLSSNTVLENQPAGTVVGTVSATELDYRDDATVTLVGGTHASSFQIVGTQLRTTEELDYEAGATRSIMLRATDNAGEYINSAVTINVEDVDDTAPQVMSRYPDENTIVVDTELEYIEVVFDEDIAFTTDGFDRQLFLLRGSTQQDSWYDAGEGDGPANSYIVDGNKLRFPLDPIYGGGSNITMLLENSYSFDSFEITDLLGNQVSIPSIAFTTRDRYTGNDILTFTADGLSDTQIDAQNHTITGTMDANTTLSLTPTVTFSQGASCLPLTNGQPITFESGVAQDFTVRAENGVEVPWQVTLTWPAMAGTFLIGADGDFVDLDAAFAEIESRGMSGDVTFALMNGHADYKQGFTYWSRYPGSDTYTTTITIDEGATSASIGNYLIFMEGVQNMVIDGQGVLEFVNVVANNKRIWIRDNDEGEISENITIKNVIGNCGNGFVNIYEANNIVIENNVLNSDGGNSMIDLTTGSQNVTIHNNEMNIINAGGNDTGINVGINSGHVSIINNDIVMKTNANGTKLTGIRAGTYNTIDIYHNTVSTSGTNTNTGGGDKIISFYSSSGNTANVKNNILHYTGASLAIGIVFTGAENIADNNISMPFSNIRQFYMTDYGVNEFGDGEIDDVAGMFSGTTGFDVVFTDYANNDLSLAEASLDAVELRGNPVDGVDTDILGNNRSSVAPSKGAYEVPNRASDFLTFSIPEQVSNAVINKDNHTVIVAVNAGTSLTNLVPTFTISPGAGIDKASGDEQDFTNPVSYQITDEQEFAQQEWVVTVSEQNLPPSDIELDPSAINENEDAGTVVGVLSGTDPNGDELVFSIVGGENSQHGYLFEIDAETNELKSKASFDFEQNEELFIRIEADDQAGETYEEAFVVTVVDVDEVAPEIFMTSPEAEVTGVALTANMVITYNEPIQEGTGSYLLKTIDGQLVESMNVSSGNVTVSGSSVTINPTENLLYDQSYYIQALAGVVEDQLGNPAPAIPALTWHFHTETIITTLSPADEADDVSPFADLVITFDEPVALQTGGVFRMFRKADDVQVGVNWSFDGATANANTVTYDIPENLEPGVEIYINIIGGIEDASGNPIDITGKDRWNFTPVIQDQTVTLNPIASKTYGQGPFVFTPATASSGQGITYTSSIESVATVSNNMITIHGAGTTTIRATQAGNTYYKSAFAEQIFTVNKAPQSISFLGPANMTYGDANHVLNGSIIPSDDDVTYEIIAGDAVTIDQDELELVIVGTGEVTIRATGVETANYLAPNPVERTFTIYKKTITATAEDKAKVYGKDNPTFTISYEGLVEGEGAEVIDTDPTAATLAVANSDVGFYDITLSGGADDNYAIQLETGQLEITKKTLTAMADNKSREYGDPNPGFSLSFDGFIAGDNASDLSGTLPSRSTEADESSSVGEYTITVTGGSDANYDFQNVNGILTVTPAEIDVFVQSADKSYGDDNPDFEMEIEGLKNGESSSVFTTQPIISTVAEKYSDAGIYDLEASGGLAENYTFDYDNSTLTIHKVEVSAEIQDSERTYGQPNDNFTIIYSGFIPGESEDDLDNAPMVTTDADQFSDVGTYDLIVEGHEDTNYDVMFADGTLTINPAQQVVVVEDITDKVKNAVPFDVEASVNSDTELQYEVDGPANNDGKTISLTGELGTVTVTVTAPASLNYLADSEQVTFEVNDKQTQTITFSISDQNYGGEVALAGSSDSNLPLNFEVVSGPITMFDGTLTFTGVGEASVRATQSGDETYNEAEPVVANFMIEKAGLTVTADDKSITYGEDFPSLTFVYDGFMNEEDASVLSETPIPSTTADASSDAGTYDISLTGGAADNYTLTLVDGTLTIDKAEATIALTDLTYDEDGTAKSPTVVTDPVDLNVSLTYDGVSEAPSAAGTYEVVAIIDETNYTGSTTATLTINEVTVTGVQPTTVEISVYPNPTSDKMSISGIHSGLAKLSLVDIEGRTVLSQDISPKEKVDVSSLKSGLYLLTLDHQNITTTTKVLIH